MASQVERQLDMTIHAMTLCDALRRQRTRCYHMQPERPTPGPIEIDGVAYYTAAQVADAAGITRQTLWRWRQRGHVPSGQRFRDRQLLFSEDEFSSVVKFANRLVPAGPVNSAAHRPTTEEPLHSQQEGHDG